jgi:hypothetical protein
MTRATILVLLSAAVALNAGLCLCIPEAGGAGHCGAASSGRHSHEDGGKTAGGSCHSHGTETKPASGQPMLPKSCCCEGQTETLLSDGSTLALGSDAGFYVIPVAIPELGVASPNVTTEFQGTGSGPPRPSRVPLHLRLHRLSI